MSLTEPLDDPGSPGPGPTQERSPRVPACSTAAGTRTAGGCAAGKARPGVGTVVTIRIQGSRAKLEGRIVRSKISTIHRDGTLSFESAIEFDTPTSVQDIVNSPTAAQAGATEGDQDVYVIDTDNDW